MENIGSKCACSFQSSVRLRLLTKLCGRQAEIIHNHKKENVRNIGQGETPHRKDKTLNLAAVMCTTVQAS
jgi:hypothetical protein